MKLYITLVRSHSWAFSRLGLEEIRLPVGQEPWVVLLSLTGTEK